MELVDNKKLESVAKFLVDDEVDCLKKPQKEAFIGLDIQKGALVLDDDYIKALEKYCNDLENVLAGTEYDLESAECENRELQDVLKKIRGVLDGKD